MAISTIGSDGLATGAVTSTKLTSGVPTRAQLPAGTVLQVVSATTTGSSTTTSTSYVASNLNATITPTSAASKIFCLVTATAWHAGTSMYARMTLYRGATNIGIGVNSGLAEIPNPGNQGYAVTTSFAYLDSPASTDALTYTMYFNSSNGTAVYVCDNAVANTITLMEIAA